jgi:hypothetical protein
MAMTTSTAKNMRDNGRGGQVRGSHRAWVVFLSAALLCVGCGLFKKPGGGAGGGSAPELDQARAVTGKISVRSGGVLAASDAQGTGIEVQFFKDSLYQDMDIELVPLRKARLHDENTVVDGVVVRKKGEESFSSHLELAQPAEIRFTIKGPARENLAVVAWSDDAASYSVLPTFRAAAKDGVVVSSAVSGFSGYGVRSLEPGETPKSGNPKSGKAEDDDEQMAWTIYVNDVVKKSVSIMNIEFRLWFVATRQGDTSGLTLMQSRDGNYTGPATMWTKNMAIKQIPSAFAVMVNVDGQLKGTVDLTVKEGDTGLGTGELTTSGKVNLKALGISEAITIKRKDQKTSNETLGLTLRTGEGGKVVVTVAGIGDFKGTMRAMKKKQEKCKDAKGKLPDHQKAILDKYPQVQNVQDKTFPTLGDALKGAAGSILPACQGTSSEWGGLICQDSNGNYHAIPGGEHHCGTNYEGEIDTGAAEGCPDQMKPAAAYHCHPSGADSKKSSDTDIDNMKNYGLDQTAVLLHSDGEGNRIIINDSSGGEPQTVKLGK